MKRANELAKELGVTNKELVLFLKDKFPELGITDPARHHGKSVPTLYLDDVVAKFKAVHGGEAAPAPVVEAPAPVVVETPKAPEPAPAPVVVEAPKPAPVAEAPKENTPKPGVVSIPASKPAPAVVMPAPA